MKIIPTIGLNSNRLLSSLSKAIPPPVAVYNHAPPPCLVAKLELRKYNALFWDLGGAPILQSIWKKYYPDCHAIIFVVDHNYAENKEELIRTFGKISTAHILKDNAFLSNNTLSHVDSVTNSEENKGVPLLILINKSVPNHPII